MCSGVYHCRQCRSTPACVVRRTVRGVPAISVGRGEGGNQHTTTEWANIDSARVATKQVVLLAAALAELDSSRR